MKITINKVVELEYWTFPGGGFCLMVGTDLKTE
jgi:hypothetical protein